jgi:hypothetical protein
MIGFHHILLSDEEIEFLRMTLGIVRKAWAGDVYIPHKIKPPIEFLIKHKIDPLLERLTVDPEKKSERLLGMVPLELCEGLPPNSVAVVSGGEPEVKTPKAPRRTIKVTEATDADKERLRFVAQVEAKKRGITVSELSRQIYGRRNAIGNYKAPSTVVSKEAIDEMCKKIQQGAAYEVEQEDVEDTIFAGIYLRRDKDHLASPGPEYVYLTVSNLLSAAQWCAKFSTNRMVKDHIALEDAEIDAVRQCKPLLAYIKRMAETDRGQFDRNFAAFVSASRARWVGGWVKLVAQKEEVVAI